MQFVQLIYFISHVAIHTVFNVQLSVSYASYEWFLMILNNTVFYNSHFDLIIKTFGKLETK